MCMCVCVCVCWGLVWKLNALALSAALREAPEKIIGDSRADAILAKYSQELGQRQSKLVSLVLLGC